MWDGTHNAGVAGIAGSAEMGAWSVALNGGYEDDFDEGYRFVYTGSGGRDKKVFSSLTLELIVVEPHGTKLQAPRLE
jgi:hypothetical protein